MVTLTEALRIAEANTGVRFYRYAESGDSFIFSSNKPGEIKYGPRPYVVSKITGEVKMNSIKWTDPWPYGEWHSLGEIENE